MPIKYLLFDDIVQDKNFPKPILGTNLIIRNPFLSVKSPFLMIPPMDDELKLITKVQPEMDAFLGQTFFMDHAWTFDYPNEQIWVNTPIPDSLSNHPNMMSAYNIYR